MKETFKIEFLLAWDDGTWTTEIFDVPISLEESSDDEVNVWWQNEYLYLDKYRHVILAAIYNIPTQEES
jgi:hypothetical protein